MPHKIKSTFSYIMIYVFTKLIKSKSLSVQKNTYILLKHKFMTLKRNSLNLNQMCQVLYYFNMYLKYTKNALYLKYGSSVCFPKISKDLFRLIQFAKFPSLYKANFSIRKCWYQNNSRVQKNLFIKLYSSM